MKTKKKLQQWKEFSKMSDLGIIARRKFFNNAFDGALTCAGIISGIFIIFLAEPLKYENQDVLITGFAIALAIGISGLWGAFLSEEAERKKKVLDMKKDMAEVKEESELLELKHIKTKYKHGNKKKPRMLLEKAERFATIVASLVNRGAPVLGSSFPLKRYTLHLITAGVVTLIVSILLGI